MHDHNQLHMFFHMVQVYLYLSRSLTQNCLFFFFQLKPMLQHGPRFQALIFSITTISSQSSLAPHCTPLFILHHINVPANIAACVCVCVRVHTQTVEAARGASLLIHEATFEDDMVEDAVRKRHSTTGDALGVAAQVRCACTHAHANITWWCLGHTWAMGVGGLECWELISG